ncbi:helix-turn-helix domain-containing protein [Nocardia seriolae]|uniref:helix-turn-helix domain-containing protein n=1 Tax=Nocardia seriolae TaxID=37332 RepID=UPI0008FF2590|nr:helix-turn-helix domain-containing protein [Nocardia seriolae]PSK30094.1 hypothetical protein C6575_17810 [Nocardia seriolae]QOW32113.1 helix-turn-helix domain-containing protein [Nocardia seriolae]QUN19724.1 helix-turn-helix domain-containing protein [Nocardia seriolae]WNJ59198.1 helix-turn-helix domain-containing protein [Nocardia seriolae]
MSRHTTFRYCLDPTVEQQQALARHADAARFAFNKSLDFVKTALTQRETDPDQQVPWTGFSLIDAFNTWKETEAAGRVIAVDPAGVAEIEVTGLAWRDEVCQQAFEEAAVDCGRALTAFSDSRTGNRKGKKVGFPRFKKKNSTTPAFRLRNRTSKAGRAAIRVGDNGIPRSVTLPRNRDDPGTGGHSSSAAHARQRARQNPVRHSVVPSGSLAAQCDRRGHRPSPGFAAPTACGRR